MKRNYTDPLTRALRDAEFWKGVAVGLTLALSLCLVAFVRVAV